MGFIYVYFILFPYPDPPSTYKSAKNTHDVDIFFHKSHPKSVPPSTPPTPKTAGVAQFFRSHCLALGSELEGWERVGKSMAKSWENPWFNRLTMKNGGLTKVSQTNGGLTVTEMELINTFDRFSRVERIGWSLLLT